MNRTIFISLLFSLSFFSACQQKGGEAASELSADTESSLDLDAVEPATDISDADIEKFLDAVEQVQTVSQVAQEEMILAVEAEGMSLDRFSEIQEKLMNPESDISPITQEEERLLDRIDAKMREMEPELERQSRAAIERTGMTAERYQALSLGIQGDSLLRSKAQIMMQNRMLQRLRESAGLQGEGQ